MICLPMYYNLFDQRWTIRAAEPGEIGTDLGQCRPDQLEVLINPAQTEESMIHTLYHEIIHSFEQKLQLEMTERQVDLIALTMIHFFRANPDAIYLIIGEDDAPGMA